MNDFEKKHEELDKFLKELISNTQELEKKNVLIYAFLRQTLNVNHDDIEDCITDGGNDHGIDAIYIDNRLDETVNVHIFQSKLYSSVRKAKRSYPINEISKIKTLLDNFLNEQLEKTRDSLNDKLYNKLLEVRDIQRDNFLEIKIWLISNGEPANEKQIQTYKTNFSQLGIVEIDEFHLYDFANLFQDKCTRNHHTFIVNGKSIIQDKNAEVDTIICYIPVSELYTKFLTRIGSDNKIDHSLFDKNIRGFLGFDKTINRQIQDTFSSSEKDYFACYNNGITMVCSNLKSNTSNIPTRIQVKDANIINGAQTCYAIFEVLKDFNPNFEKFSNVSVLLRIFETESKDLIDKIALNSNTQNRIMPRDLKAHDILQIKFENEMRKRGYKYIRRRQDSHIESNDYEDNKIIDALLAGQIILAYRLKKPSASKAKSDDIFTEKYSEIFVGLNYDEFLEAYELFCKIINNIGLINKKFGNQQNMTKQDDQLVRYGKFHILTVCSILKEDKQLNEYDVNLIILSIEIIRDAWENKQKPAFYTFFRDEKIANLIINSINQGTLDFTGI